MNNKGFAITTILFGTMILFCLLLTSLLSMLSVYKGNVEKLIENDNGARKKITMTPNTSFASLDALKASSNPKRGFYCFGNTCQYVSNGDLK